MSEIRWINNLIKPHFIIRMFSVFLALTILRMSFPHIRYPFLLFSIPFMFLFYCVLFVLQLKLALKLLILTKDKNLTNKYKVSFENVKEAYPDIQWGSRS